MRVTSVACLHADKLPLFRSIRAPTRVRSRFVQRRDEADPWPGCASIHGESRAYARAMDSAGKRYGDACPACIAGHHDLTRFRAWSGKQAQEAVLVAHVTNCATPERCLYPMACNGTFDLCLRIVHARRCQAKHLRSASR